MKFILIYLIIVKFVVMHIQNIMKQVYGSTEAFIADVRWILHNCIIFNGSKLTLIVIFDNITSGKFCHNETISRLFYTYIH